MVFLLTVGATIFSYCPTFGHEWPPNVGDSLVVIWTASAEIHKLKRSGYVDGVITINVKAAPPG
ncbi:MAG TPA: hypothetical protein VGW77_35355 [Candidatus Binatia bacterium]|nr:hypothetical protein [Candidatus Binatia bacterium]